MNKKKWLALSLSSGLVFSSIVSFNALSFDEAGFSASTTPMSEFSAVSMEPDLVSHLAKAGERLSEPMPQGMEESPELGSPFDMPEEPKPLPLGPVDSVQKTLAILVKFPAEPGTSSVPGAPAERLPATMFDDLLFGTSYDPYSYPLFSQYAEYNGIKAPTDRTLYNYYKEVSYGAMDVTTEHLPSDLTWVTAPHPYSYYMKSAYGFGTYPNNVQGLLEDVVKAVDAQVDFSEYAINGEVPGVFIIHEGTGAEWSRDPQQIWSHKWSLNWVYENGGWVNKNGITLDGVKVSTYSMEPEIGGNVTGFGRVDGAWGYYDALKSGPYPPQVGVYAHEFAHVLGLPDLYDYGYNSQGVGAWSVMAGGSWTRYPNSPAYSGNTPVHLDAWNKYFAGFSNVVTLDNNKTESFSLTNAVDSNTIYKIDVPRSHGTEYFLIENRQQKGFDQGLSRYGSDVHGMVVWHVDDNVMYRSFWRPNEAENFNPLRNGERWGNGSARNGEHHYGVSLLQADGKFDLENLAVWYGGTGNSGDSGDAYPGSTGKTELELLKDFYSGSYYNWPGSNGTGFFGIKNIKETNGVISGTFTTDYTGSYKK